MCYYHKDISTKAENGVGETRCLVKFRPSKTVSVHLLAAVMALGVSACATSGGSQAVQAVVSFPALQEEAVAGEIARLESALSDPVVNRTEKSRLLFQLALLHFHPDNPEPDYKQAAEYLEASADTSQVIADQYVRMLFQHLRKTVQENEVLQQKLAARQQQNLVLERKCADLVRENREKKEIIKKLQYLDVELEKKRKRSGSR